jgi:hypothetical protein
MDNFSVCEKDYEWIQRNYPELQKKYPDRYIAIRDKNVIASGNLSEVLKETKSRHCLVEYIQSGELFAYDA